MLFQKNALKAYKIKHLPWFYSQLPGRLVKRHKRGAGLGILHVEAEKTKLGKKCILHLSIAKK
jgi:hypothetical protein